MGSTLLAVFLVLYALVAFGLGIPTVILGIVAGLAGILLLVGR